MVAKNIKVILVNYPNDKTTQTKLKMKSWTNQQKQDFINFVKGYNPTNDFYNASCFFNVHVDDYVIHSVSSKKPKLFKPMHVQNKANEIIIEIIVDEEKRDCWITCPTTCPFCLQDGQCTSPFINNIRKFLFPDTRTK